MTSERQLLRQFVVNQQASLTTLVDDWIAEHSNRLLHRHEVVIGPFTSAGAKQVYDILCVLTGFETRIAYLAVSPSHPQKLSSADYYMVRFTGELDKPDQTLYNAWQAKMIQYLVRTGEIQAHELMLE